MSQSSKGIMYAHQAELPNLPVPALEDTMQKVLKSIRAVTNDDEYHHSEACVREFLATVGSELQSVLEERAANSRNWLEEWWEQYVYLQPRYPIATWINWSGVAPAIDWKPYIVDQLQAAAIYIYHTLLFREEVIHERLEPDTLAGRKLCMAQFERMFNSCRIAQEGMDMIQTYEGSRHMILMLNDRICKVTVLDEDMQMLPLADIYRGVCEASKLMYNLFDLDKVPPVSVLTSEDRDVWARERERLLLNKTNEYSLNTIESALFVMSLERTSPTTLTERSKATLLGRDHAGRGLWYDKPFNYVIYANGLGSLNGEHTWADAMIVVRQQDWILRSARKQLERDGVVTSEPPSPKYTPPELLKWELSPESCTAIEVASSKIIALNRTIDISILEFYAFGKDLCKRFRYPPDFVMQMAIQLAYYRMTQGKHAATYETGHTRLFYHGRTETIRACSTDSNAFCESMGLNALCKDGLSGEIEDVEKKAQLLQQAIKTHFATAKDSMMGQGIDRHLLGLYIVAQMKAQEEALLNGSADSGTQQLSTKIPALFTDPGFVRSKRYILSTSNVSVGTSRSLGGYSPFFNGGYGICYSIMDQNILVAISHAKGHGTDNIALKGYLSDALIDIAQVMILNDKIMKQKATK